MEKTFFKGLVEKVEEDGIISVAVATDASIDRDGEIVDPAGIDMKNFERNPVLLYAHDYRSDPIGKVLNIKLDGNRILFTPQFAIGVSDRAKQYYEMVKAGFLNAFSIGFIPKEYKDRQNTDGTTSRVFTRSELLEISLVPVPANPNALVLARSYKGMQFDESILKEIEQYSAEDKSVIPYANEGVAEDTGTAWSGQSEMAACGDDAMKLKRISAWYDSGENKGAKLPHHQTSDMRAVWRGVSSAMAALMGARGGVDIPEADRKGVYDHLAKHYAEFGKVAPDYKLIEAQVLKDVELEIDAPIVVNVIHGDPEQVKTLADDIANIKKTLADNGDKGTKNAKVDELITHPDFQSSVLKAIDRVVGMALRDMKRRDQ